MRNRVVLFLLFVWCGVLTGAARADGPYHIVTNQLPPLKFDDNGVASGITVDILAALMQAIDEPFDPADVQSMPWARAYEDAKTIPGTIILSMARTEAREPLFKWVGPVYSIQLGLIGRKNKDFSVRKAADAAKYTVGALRDTAPVQLLVRQGFPESRVHYLARTEQALKMLAQGRIDLFAHTADSSFYMMPSLGMDPTKYEIYYVIEQDIPLYIGFHRGFSDAFVSRLQRAFDNLRTPGSDGMSRYDAIVDKYLPDRSYLKGKTK